MIQLVRVDHRLLHGQVAFSWTKQLGADCILIANDDVVQDELRMAALRLAKPGGVKLVIKSIEDSIESLNKGVTDKYKLFVIVSNLDDAYSLAKHHKEIKTVNLGGLKKTEDKKQISKAISVNEHDIETLNKMNEMGLELEIRLVPNDSKVNPMDLI